MITFHVQHWCNFPASLRFSKKKESHAIIMKVRLPSYTCVTCHMLRVSRVVWQVDRERQLIVEDFRLEDCDAEEVAGELPTHQPRFLVRVERTSWELISRLLWERIYLSMFVTTSACRCTRSATATRTAASPTPWCSCSWLRQVTRGSTRFDIWYIISIQGVSVELSMMYAGSKNNLVK